MEAESLFPLDYPPIIVYTIMQTSEEDKCLDKNKQ